MKNFKSLLTVAFLAALAMALPACPDGEVNLVETPDDDDTTENCGPDGVLISNGTECLCDDGIDNNSDGLADCDDQNCWDDPVCAGDDDDATTDDDDATTDDDDSAGDDDDSTTDDDDSAEPPVTIACVNAGAPSYDGGDWKLCWESVWAPTLSLWSNPSVGGMADEIAFSQTIWLTFGAANQASANAIVAEFGQMVEAGQVVFANVSTGAVSALVWADAPTATPYSGYYRLMVSPSAGSASWTSPVTSVTW